MATSTKLRLDKYLWAIRIFKTRTQAALAIEENKVKCGGVKVKSSKPVLVGETYEIKTDARKWVIEVTSLLHNRVQYSEAILHYLDKSPAQELAIKSKPLFADFTGKRHSKQGRPTKKNRRELDSLNL